ncbi:MAG: CvpA family protein [Cellvibrionales bacterium]|jgi:membrane protein required for colicin V production
MNDIEQQLSGATAGFNGFDWLIVAVVAISMGIGIYRGLSREIMSLLGWSLAFFGANILAQPLADSLTQLTNSDTLRYAAGWALVFIGVLAIFTVLGSLMARQMRQPGFNIGNRLLGGAFGVLRGIVVVVVLTFLIRAAIPSSEQDLLRRSELMPLVDEVAEWLGGRTAEIIDAEPVEQIEESLDSAEMI